MNIILVSEKLSKARTITLTLPQLVVGAVAAAVSVLVLAFCIQWLVLRYAPSLNSPLLNSLILSVQHEQNEKVQSYLRENLNAKIGRAHV